ncbi:MAG: hypothetical protein G01um101413_348 [Parcubacteria group bacterium Gr01-1014_13]|nr:MAG: hypothetical protein G01um101413_348 [Parcubacteria group bacterium Gr01-1014_13]
MSSSIHFTQVFGIRAKEEDLDFFDTNLKYDSALFIDPFLIKRSRKKEERDLFNRFNIFFKRAYELSLTTKGTPDEYIKLKRFFKFKEPKEIYLGYTEGSNKGAGLGERFADAITKFYLERTLVKQLADEKNYPDNQINPAIFSIIGDQLGPDGISDLSAGLLMDYLIKYTKEQCDKLGVPRVELPVREQFDFKEFQWTGGVYEELPRNPFNGEAIILVPKRFLRAQTITSADSAKSKIVGILKDDVILKERFVNIVTKSLDEIEMKEIYAAMEDENSLIRRYLELVERQDPGEYNFVMDLLQFLAVKNFKNYFKNTEKKEVNSCSDLKDLLFNFLESFNHYMEYKGGWNRMWKKKRTANSGHCKEVVVGRLLHGMAYSFFQHYPDTTFDTEVKTGRGYIDFRLIKGSCRIVIELKNLCNDALTGEEPKIPAYLHGISRQLPIYAIGEKASYAVYLTSQHYKSGKAKERNDSLRIDEIKGEIFEAEEKIKKKNKQFQKLLYYNIDISPRPVPSKA